MGLDDSAAALFTQLRSPFRHPLMVIGGSAALWGYNQCMSTSQWQGHVMLVSQLSAVVSQLGVMCGRGVDQLFGVGVADNIGHIKLSCENIVCSAYTEWCHMAMRTGSLLSTQGGTRACMPHKVEAQLPLVR